MRKLIQILIKFVRRIVYYFYKVYNNYFPKSNLIQVKLLTLKNKHSFFGYYNISPWDINNRYFLYLNVSFSHRMPKSGDVANICMLDTEDGKYYDIANTRAWCWQQGCMLQWIGVKNEQEIIYNDYLNGKYISVIHNPFDNTRRIFPKPVYALSRDGNNALTLNFSRLDYIRPGYGYVNIPFNDIDELYPSNDGIWLLDLLTGQSSLIISIEKLVRFQWRKEFEESFHWVNHLEFNPKGNRFVFFHRWKVNNKTYNRMLAANLDGGELYSLSNHDVSHFCWKNDTQLVAWARQPEGDKYWIFEDMKGCISSFAPGILEGDGDGHPSFSSDGRWLITDTYPGWKRRSQLILYDTKNFKKFILGDYFAPMKYSGPIRCDLHPRWSRDGSAICFDSVHEGFRGVYIIELDVFLNSVVI